MANKTTVSNPYNFNINRNTSFSTTINAVLPDKETVLYEADDSIVSSNRFINLTIPSGVNVVKVYCFADITESDSGVFSSASVASYINDKFNKSWAVAEVESNDQDDITKYVGVTPGKTYRLEVWCFVGNTGSAYLSISYSSTINAHAVDVEDY